MTDEADNTVDHTCLEYCLAALREDPDAHYKEVRRAARADKGLTLKRHVWTLARQQLGLRTDEESGETQDPEPKAPPAPMQPAWTRPQRPPEPAPPLQEPGGFRRRPAWAMPQSGPPQFPDAPRAAPPSRMVPQQLPEFLRLARNPVEFMVGYLQQVNRDASFAEVEAAANEFSFTVYPTTFGRAQAIVGIVEAPRPGIPAAPPHHPPVMPAPVMQAPAAPVAPPAAPIPVAPSMASSAAPATPAAPATEASAPQDQAATDPTEGLMNFFRALDRSSSRNVHTRALVEHMLHVVSDALIEPELEPEPESPAP